MRSHFWIGFQAMGGKLVNVSGESNAGERSAYGTARAQQQRDEQSERSYANPVYRVP